MKMKNRSQRYEINRPKTRHGHKSSKYKNCLIILICIKQHLSNIWSSIHEKVKQHWSWVENNIAYKKHCLKPPFLPSSFSMPIASTGGVL